MIVVRVDLASAHGRHRDAELATVIVDNVWTSESGKIANYRARAFRKGDLAKHGGDPRQLVSFAKPHRDGLVEDHRRDDEPVGNLVAESPPRARLRLTSPPLFG